jgi:hypothetical protein
VKQKERGAKQNLQWKLLWNENDNIERIVYNDQVLKEHKKKAIKFLQTQFNKDWRSYRRDVAPLYTERNIQELYKTMPKKELKNYIKEGEKLEEEYRYRQKARMEKKEKISNMTLEEYYESLNAELRVKLINERIARTFDDIDTQVGTEDLVSNDPNEEEKSRESIIEEDEEDAEGSDELD